MTIHGISQTTGVERRLKVENGGDGVVLILVDHLGERDRILVQPDPLLEAVTEPPEGGSTVEGVFPPQGEKRFLDVEVRRNEVQLRLRGSAAEGLDVAVGLDDFQDALEGAITRG
jgi:hypothetical protein